MRVIFDPPIYHPHEALNVLTEAIQKAGHTGKIKIGIDPASQSFFKDDKYDIEFKTDKPEKLSPVELGELYESLLRNYPIVLLEDPFEQDDWESFARFNKTCQIELVGDDLLATKSSEPGLLRKSERAIVFCLRSIRSVQLHNRWRRKSFLSPCSAL